MSCTAIEKPYQGMRAWEQGIKGDFTFAQFYWQNKFSIQYNLDDFGIFSGLEMSNQDIYDKRRSVKIEGVSLNDKLPELTKYRNSIFIGVRFTM